MNEETELDAFVKRYTANDNEWWKLDSGDMQNFFDAALEKIGRVTANWLRRTRGLPSWKNHWSLPGRCAASCATD